jgi:hypothetical protein
MPLELRETKILPNAVYMRLADNPDPARAVHWIEFQVPLNDLTLPSSGGDLPLGDEERRYLGSIRLAALRYARDRLGEETQVLAGRVGH